jgi:hypothetical protein
MKNASLKVSEEVWGKVKVHCVTHGVKIQKWVEESLIGAMNSNQSPKLSIAPFTPSPYAEQVLSSKYPTSRPAAPSVPKKNNGHADPDFEPNGEDVEA